MQRTDKTVLIVDDNFDFAETVAILLRIHGYFPCVATSRMDALVYVGDGDFAFCLLDFRMEGMAPEVFIAATRSRCPNISFVLMSGIGDIYEEASKLGISSVIPKSSGVDLILPTLERIAAAKQPPSSGQNRLEFRHSNS
jgi:DNA-binding NtrC family response regulator